MKCPKCGYNSFEFLDSCKKCSTDLAAFKEAHAIRAIILPFKQPKEAAFPPEEEDAVELLTEVAAAPDTGDIFNWAPPSAAASPAETDEAFAGLGTEMPPAGENMEADLFSFDLDSPPEAVPPGKLPEEPAGGFSFEELCGTNGEPPQEPGHAGEPFTEESLAGLLESTPDLGSQLAQENGADPLRKPAPPLDSDTFGESSLADLLESTPAVDDQREEAEFAISDNPVAALDAFGDDSLAGLLESGPDLASQPEDGGYATQDMGEPAANVNTFGADLPELEPTSANCGPLETPAAPAPEEFAIDDFREFGEEPPGEAPQAMGPTETPQPAADFDFEEFFREEDDAPAEPVKGAAIEELGLSKDEFDALFGEAQEAEKIRSAG